MYFFLTYCATIILSHDKHTYAQQKQKTTKRAIYCWQNKKPHLTFTINFHKKRAPFQSYVFLHVSHLHYELNFFLYVTSLLYNDSFLVPTRKGFRAHYKICR